VLPEVKDVTFHRQGDRRWIEINAKPQTLWPRLEGFWREKGILLVEKNPTTGVMVTDWIENRAEIKRDPITNLMRKVLDGLHSTGTRDQYRLRIEPGPRPGTTDVFLTHRGMEERLLRNTVGEDSNTMWEAVPSDPDKEAAMLRSLMVYLGVTDTRAKRVVAEESRSAAVARARLEQEGGGGVLVIEEDLRTAWRLVGVALDRSGFAVEDRDLTQGVYYVRYDDPSKGEKKKGFLSNMAFWRDDKIDTVTQYQVRLTASGAETRVEVRDQAGNRDNSPTALNILTLVKEELR
jgi:outer membrane protein assembly factor BamC